jgi:5-methylcytosine-specific restriction endonuclease McrA
MAVEMSSELKNKKMRLKGLTAEALEEEARKHSKIIKSSEIEIKKLNTTYRELHEKLDKLRKKHSSAREKVRVVVKKRAAESGEAKKLEKKTKSNNQLMVLVFIAAGILYFLGIASGWLIIIGALIAIGFLLEINSLFFPETPSSLLDIEEKVRSSPDAALSRLINQVSVALTAVANAQEKIENLPKSSSLTRQIADAKEWLTLIAEAKKLAKRRERSARLSAYEGKARQGSQALKKQLLSKVKSASKVCPYCCVRTPKKNLVMDHIHPVAKGGQTVLQNSILICQPCNSSKRALTLRAFCKKAGHDFETVAARLERQGKWV